MAPLTHTVDPLETVEDSALVQLVYVSSITLSTRLKASIFDEVEGHARDYNEQHGITGTLCYGNGHFLQCIEGKKSNVLALQKPIFGALVVVASDQEASHAVVAFFTVCPAWLDLEAYGAIFADYQNV